VPFTAEEKDLKGVMKQIKYSDERAEDIVEERLITARASLYKLFQEQMPFSDPVSRSIDPPGGDMHALDDSEPSSNQITCPSANEHNRRL